MCAFVPRHAGTDNIQQAWTENLWYRSIDLVSGFALVDAVTDAVMLVHIFIAGQTRHKTTSLHVLHVATAVMLNYCDAQLRHLAMTTPKQA